MPLKVHWQITEACNYRCSCCYLAKSGYKNNHCSLEQAETAIRHIASSNRNGYWFSLLGGEPTLHPQFADIIKLLKKYLGNRLKKISMITNGSMNKKAIASINELASECQITLSISVHFEFVKTKKIIELIKSLSENVGVVFW